MGFTKTVNVFKNVGGMFKSQTGSKMILEFTKKKKI